MTNFLQVTSFDPLLISATTGAHVVSGAVNGSNHLILTMSDNSTIDCGVVGGAVASVNGRTGAVTLSASDVGLTTAGGDLTGTYPNPTLKNTGTAGTTGDASHSLTVTTDAQGRVTAVVANPIQVAESQVTNLVTDLAAKAPLASPAFTGTPTAPTAGAGTNTTQVATTAFVTTAVAGGGGGTSPANNTPIMASGYGLAMPLDGTTAPATGLSPSSGVYLYPFVVDKAGHLTGIEFHCSAAGTTGAKAYAAIYSAAADGSPGTLLSAIGGGVACDSGSGIRGNTGLSIAIPAGKYWVAFCGNPVNAFQMAYVNISNFANTLTSGNYGVAAGTPAGALTATIANAMTGTSWNSTLGALSVASAAQNPCYRLDFAA